MDGKAAILPESPAKRTARTCSARTPMWRAILVAAIVALACPRVAEAARLAVIPNGGGARVTTQPAARSRGMRPGDHGDRHRPRGLRNLVRGRLSGRAAGHADRNLDRGRVPGLERRAVPGGPHVHADARRRRHHARRLVLPAARLGQGRRSRHRGDLRGPVRGRSRSRRPHGPANTGLRGGSPTCRASSSRRRRPTRPSLPDGSGRWAILCARCATTPRERRPPPRRPVRSRRTASAGATSPSTASSSPRTSRRP